MKSKRVIIVSILVLSFLFAFGMTIVLLLNNSSSNVIINEVCSKNYSVASNEENLYRDYLELYNASWLPVSMTGFSLSDDINDTNKADMTSIIIQPKSRYVIWLDKCCSVGHADFALATSKEETVFLFDSLGNAIDSVTVPPLRYNMSYARTTDGAAEWQIQPSTCGDSNIPYEFPHESYNVEIPKFSYESGVFDNEFELELYTDSDLPIYYTLDGSNPGLDDNRYDSPIRICDISDSDNVLSSRNDLVENQQYIPNFPVDKAIVVRAVCYDERNNAFSPIASNTYYIGEYLEKYNGYPLVSVITDSNNLFDSERGIYLNFTNKGREWERPATIIYLDEYRNAIINQNVGIRIAGGSSRNREQKSLSIYVRDIYERPEDYSGFLQCSVIDDFQYDTIKLRNGGSQNRMSKIMDPFLEAVGSNLNIGTQSSRPCVMFLNGEYWGVYSITERYEESYFVNHYDISYGDLMYLDAGYIEYGGTDAWNDWQSILEYAESNDCSNDSVYEEISSRIDIDSFIDLVCYQLFIDNQDVFWDKNIGYWRTYDTDSKWRFVIYDTDISLQGYDRDNIDNLLIRGSQDETPGGLLYSLLDNDEFKYRLCDRYCELADKDFSYEVTHKILQKYIDLYSQQVVYDHQRFLRSDYSMKDFHKEISGWDEFLKNRNDYIIGYLKNEVLK